MTSVRRPLFWKYVAYFSGLVSALLMLSGAIGGYFAYQESTSALEALQRAKADVVASEIATFIGRLTDDLQSVVIKFSTGEVASEEDLRTELVTLLRHQPSITELRWIAADGRERFAHSRLSPDSSDSGHNWSDDPRFAATRNKSQYISPVYFRRETEPYLSIAATRKATGPVLVAEVNLKFIWDVISRIRIGTAGVAYVVDSQGQLVSHRDISLVLRKPDLVALPHVAQALRRGGTWSGQAHDLDGAAVFAISVPIEQFGWTVFVEQPRDEAMRPVYASIARSIALVLVGVIASVTASLLFAQRMVQPIRQLESRAREIGEGKLDQRIDVGKDDELEALGEQFNRMAERLQLIHATQEKVIAERTHELALANDAKTRFVAAASHDLRQPIHALALFVGQLRADPESRDAPALIGRIERSIDALEELLEALLDLSKLDVGSVIPQRKRFPAQPFLSRLVGDFVSSAEAKGLALTLVPTQLWLHSDPMLLDRILRNLISNAIRYTTDGRILIGCRRRGDNVELVVADTGLGIAPAHLPYVFQEFYQAGPLLGGLTKGLGLGLAIVKRLSDLLNHRIELESTLGRGTIVRIQVPRAESQILELASPTTSMPNLHGTRVLVVDDDPAARDAIQGLLAQWGCDVVVVSGGEEAVAQARTRRPDVVLCDLRLADGVSGVLVVDRLKREHGAGLPCAFITGESALERIAEARNTGDPIAFKPTKPAKLRALIEHLLHSQ